MEDHVRVFCTTPKADDGNDVEYLVQDGTRVGAASVCLERETGNINNLNYATLHWYGRSGLDEPVRR